MSKSIISLSLEKSSSDVEIVAYFIDLTKGVLMWKFRAFYTPD